MKRGTKIAIAAGLLATVAAGGIVYAQAPGRGFGPMMGGPARMCDRGPAMLSGWLAYTQARLNLTAEQKPAWSAFETDVRSAADTLIKLCPELNQPPIARGDIAGQLARHERMLGAGLDAVKIARPAVEKLNAALTPEQRTRFAELVPGPGGPRGRFGMGPDRRDDRGRGFDRFDRDDRGHGRGYDRSDRDDRRDGPPTGRL